MEEVSNERRMEAWIINYNRFINETVLKYVSFAEKEDAIQDVFNHVWEKIDEYDESAGVLFTTWAGKVMHNFLIDAHMKKVDKEPELVSEWDAFPPDVDSEGSWIEDTYAGDSLSTANPEDLMIMFETGSEMDEKLATLTNEQYDVWILRAHEGMDYDEICQRLGIDGGAARKRFQRAKEKMME